MTEPAYGSTTEEIWERLPDHFRRMDAFNDWAFKKYINLIGSQLQKVDDLVERIDYDRVSDGGEPGETSDLANPAAADVSWLPWLGQLFGVYVRGKGQESDREAVIQASAGFNAGTPAAIEAAAKDVLVGSKFVKVYKRMTPTGVGTFWDLLLVTIDSETLKNLYPEIQATTAETVTWTASVTAGYTVTKKIVRVDKNVYNHGAMELSFAGTGTISNVTLVAPKGGPVTATDWYQGMITVWSGSGASYTGTIGITYYDVGGTVVGSTTTAAITVTGEPTQFLVGANAPATATQLSIQIVLTSGVPVTEKIYVAQLAARHEINDYWIPKTADPIQAVIDKGAKPAGFKLWYGVATSSWDDVLADNPTWADWEAAGSWSAIEETTL